MSQADTLYALQLLASTLSPETTLQLPRDDEDAQPEKPVTFDCLAQRARRMPRTAPSPSKELLGALREAEERSKSDDHTFELLCECCRLMKALAEEAIDGLKDDMSRCHFECGSCVGCRLARESQCHAMLRKMLGAPATASEGSDEASCCLRSRAGAGLRG